MKALHPWHTSILFFFVPSLFPKVMSAIQFPKSLPCDVTPNLSDASLTVDCSDRHLTEFPQGIPSNVTNLTLAINHIPEIDPRYFEHFEKLLEIDFRCNCIPVRLGSKVHVCTEKLKIQRDSFARLPSLESLYLDGNQLSTIPQGLPSNLRLLSLEANSIFSIKKENMSGLENLTYLFLGQNCYHRNPCNDSFDIEETAFQNLTSLTVLSLKSNNLTKIPDNLSPTLKELYLYNNKIHSVGERNLSHLSNLEILDLSGNCPRCHNAPYPCEECPHNASISIHPNAFYSLKRLKILRLHSTSLQRVDPNWFRNTNNLEVLDLSQNYLATEIEHAQFLMFLPKLVQLDFSFNFNLREYPTYLKLSDTFSHLSNLQVLRIRGYVFKELNHYALENLIHLKNLTVLDFGTNFIRNVNLSIFKQFPALKTINLSFNKISPLSHESLHSVGHSNGQVAHSNSLILRDVSYFSFDDRARSCKSKDTEAAYSLPFESSCSKYGKTLDLSRNNMFFINPSDFQQLAHIECLNLSGNAMSQTLNGTEFLSLPGLKYLDFSNNRLDLLYSTAFQELKKLEVLDLSDNSYYFQAEGITHMLNFTKNLVSLRKLIMNGNEISTTTNKWMESDSLHTLEFRKNRLDILWRDGSKEYLSLFSNLTSLEQLDISDNSLSFIPPDAFDGLPSKLRVLRLANNKMKKFNWGKLQVLLHLEILDLSNNQLGTIPRELSNCSKTLQKFIVQNNWIRKLSNNFLQGAFQLKYLDLSFNRIKKVKNSSLPKDVINNLDTLLLHGNPFTCNCDLVWFVWWINQTNVTIPLLATDVTCEGPGAWKGKSVILLDLNTCELDLSPILYFVFVSVILSLMVITVMSHLYFWDAWYLYHFCAANFKGYKRMSSPDVVYDAFVAYDKKDKAVTEWVQKELVEKLEDEKQFNLYLEERDWLPGCPVLDNLAESIQMSRKTIFVLTNRYIADGSFMTAFYMAHQRLIEEKADVIILIFLEKVLQKSKYLQLRKRLCSKSVLEWPASPGAQGYFWQCLKNTLKTNNSTRYDKLFKEMV
ncbi:toll-like receptor 7 [Tiliqua scincoides]|uniref:toll-like receptor 7 n=1 Tax=Tiliqua scincoides TaxID=71010 RepID=UPI0034630A25